MPLIERCQCDGRTFVVLEAYGLPMRQCWSCGVMHQYVEMDADELERWYRDRYHAEVYAHSYHDDLEAARKRLARYNGSLRPPVLDVSCGNGAFVNACRHAGLDAEGYDIGGDAAAHRSLEHLPDAGYGTVTMHDVLEHVAEPVALLREVRRLAETLIVEVPAFFELGGEHHWKPTEMA